jgi:hypothetical protein
MYDGINSLAAVIAKAFPDTTMVAGYINGYYAWTRAEWDLFPHANHVTISITASANAGDVLDVENGDATPAQTEAWIAMRKSAGYDRPTIYCSRSVIPEVRLGTGPYILARDYDIWVADWTGSAHEVTAPGAPSASCCATQYESTADYDVSAVYDSGWPHRTQSSAKPPLTKPPAAPADVRATTVAPTAMTLAWNGVAGATDYLIRVTYQGKLVTQKSVTATSSTVSGLVPDHTYTVHVAASNSAGTSAEAGLSVKTPR